MQIQELLTDTYSSSVQFIVFTRWQQYSRQRFEISDRF